MRPFIGQDNQICTGLSNPGMMITQDMYKGKIIREDKSTSGFKTAKASMTLVL